VTADDRLKAALVDLSEAYDQLDAIESLDDLQRHAVLSLRGEVAGTMRRLRNVLTFRESLETSAGESGRLARADGHRAQARRAHAGEW
jgi:hypothetical protein